MAQLILPRDTFVRLRAVGAADITVDDSLLLSFASWGPMMLPASGDAGLWIGCNVW